MHLRIPIHLLLRGTAILMRRSVRFKAESRSLLLLFCLDSAISAFSTTWFAVQEICQVIDHEGTKEVQEKLVCPMRRRCELQHLSHGPFSSSPKPRVIAADANIEVSKSEFDYNEWPG